MYLPQSAVPCLTDLAGVTMPGGVSSYVQLLSVGTPTEGVLNQEVILEQVYSGWVRRGEHALDVTGLHFTP